MWDKVLDNAMRRFITVGALEVTYPDGSTNRYGEADAEPVRVEIHDPDIMRRFILNPDLAAGEGYVDQKYSIGDDDIKGFLTLALRNRRAGGTPGLMQVTQDLAGPVQRFLAHNRVSRSRQNVQHHYDLSTKLYDLFLDKDRQYSCAYFKDWDMTLEEAQDAKKHHIAKKLCLREGDRVLDIGCGWGGMALTLAKEYGAQVVGVTLSTEQHRMARERVSAAGLDGQVDIRLQDYREVEGRFDRIVSVGMFEHVGAPHYTEYFRHVRDMLTEDGVALIHTIGSLTEPRATSPWIRRYIFPGGYIPSLSEIVSRTERLRLELTDVEVLRLHYARTLQHWHQRFMDRIEEARQIYDERFTRLWRYYFAASELAFTVERLAVFQVQLTRNKEAVPITRDYVYGN